MAFIEQELSEHFKDAMHFLANLVEALEDSGKYPVELYRINEAHEALSACWETLEGPSGLDIEEPLINWEVGYYHKEFPVKKYND